MCVHTRAYTAVTRFVVHGVHLSATAVLPRCAPRAHGVHLSATAILPRCAPRALRKPCANGSGSHLVVPI